MMEDLFVEQTLVWIEATLKCVLQILFNAHTYEWPSSKRVLHENFHIIHYLTYSN
jgi:hypothetical protein